MVDALELNSESITWSSETRLNSAVLGDVRLYIATGFLKSRVAKFTCETSALEAIKNGFVDEDKFATKIDSIMKKLLNRLDDYRQIVRKYEERRALMDLDG